MPEILPITPALWSMLFGPHCATNYASIISSSLLLMHFIATVAMLVLTYVCITTILHGVAVLIN